MFENSLFSPLVVPHVLSQVEAGNAQDEGVAAGKIYILKNMFEVFLSINLNASSAAAR